MGGYRDKTLRRDFDDLADGCFVVIRNPKLATRDELRTEPGDTSDPDEIAARSNRYLERFVVEWSVPDRDNDGDLPLPNGDGTTIAKVPYTITNWIDTLVAGVLDPT